ncbi:hypothetical protein CVIRNUC_004161 [Coccomyxa viridis]|uniref:Uncharacterized protein n=1 Tax=Coccomyxa viridis TaxID=1274662 RepID=A0AAV1I296_9CHLO|nr:hypothetical protein CVIRNUC_004161 [Coccomyxa viridis]
MQAKPIRSIDRLSGFFVSSHRPLCYSPTFTTSRRRLEALSTQDVSERTLLHGSASATREEDGFEESLPVSVPMGYEALELEAAKAVDREDGLQQYAELKQHMLARTGRFGALLSGYLFLAVSGPAALAACVGTAGSWAYLRLLINDMDNVSESSMAPFRMAQAQPQGPVRLLLLGFASYRQALKPRLLIIVGLTAALAFYNSAAEHKIGLVEESALFAGFLSYKASLLLEIWDSTKPKFDPELLGRQPRPQLRNLPDADIEDTLRKIRERK